MASLDLHRVAAIEGDVVRFRLAIEKCKSEFEMLPLRSFPRGSCGDASLLLSEFLLECGHGEFDYMLGEREKRSHAWLQQGNLIVDMTADQFQDQPRQVIVTPESKWHLDFKGKRQHGANIRLYSVEVQELFLREYALIKRYLA